jgi:hypothetical protein
VESESEAEKGLSPHTCLSGLVYKGSKAYVSERRHPNTANPEGLVRRRYVVGKEDQTSGNINVQVSNS